MQTPIGHIRTVNMIPRTMRQQVLGRVNKNMQSIRITLKIFPECK